MRGITLPQLAMVLEEFLDAPVMVDNSLLAGQGADGHDLRAPARRGGLYGLRLAICASAQYALRARAEGAPVQSLYWLTFDGLSAATRVDTPTLMVHSHGCVFPQHVRQVHGQLTGPKELVWAEGNQIDLYDQPQQVNTAVQAARGWFDRTMPS
jgi:fermentation-respiration switch protein FrsA (DUF1100 family)